MVATSGFNAPEAHRSLKDARSGLQRSLATVVIGRSLSPAYQPCWQGRCFLRVSGIWCGFQGLWLL